MNGERIFLTLPRTLNHDGTILVAVIKPLMYFSIFLREKGFSTYGHIKRGYRNRIQAESDFKSNPRSIRDSVSKK